jgi:peptide/nickel transport system permease protein
VLWVTLLFAAILGITAGYMGGIVDEVVNLLTNIFLVIPAIPLLIVMSGYLGSRGMSTMALVIALVLWAFEARILRAQTLSFKNRDFVLAAKAAGEPTRRIVFGELMPNMISRIAAGFLLVFYLSIIFAAGLEFLGFGDVNKITWGTTLYWAQNNSSVLQGAWWHFVFPGVALALSVAALVFINFGVDELANPAVSIVDGSSEVMGTGPLHVPKLPGIPGIESFRGHSFHTSRWDYDYTGGDPSGAPTYRSLRRRELASGANATTTSCS